MAADTIKAGLNVVTRIGGVAGVIESITRHPVTRSVLAVIIVPDGGNGGDPLDNIVTSLRNLKAA